jgi:putative heme-binding domain-containing protein
VGRNGKYSAGLRLEALAAINGRLPEMDADLFDFLNSHVSPDHAVMMRSSASSVLAKARLNAEQQMALIDSLKKAGPLEMTKLLSAFDAKEESVGLKLVAALQESKALSSLRPDLLRPRLTNFPESVQQKGEELLALINADAGKQRAHLEELAAHLKGGDVRRGQTIFNSSKAACSSCHAIGYLGGKVGPDLTRIGEIRTERDLLESIVYPSASFVRSYEPIVISTKSGDDYTGVLRKDAPDEVVLATGPETEVRIARQDIAEMRPGAISTMPQGLDEQLTRPELADLVAFLKATQR